MKPQFLGDSHDLVKRSLLRWLTATGSWSSHPMFTEPFSSEEVDCYEHLLRTHILSCEVLTSGMDRDAYLDPARDCPEHVFLDPDTGIQLKPTRGQKAPRYIFGTELVEIAKARPGLLTLVFDQSVQRGAEFEQIQRKLSYLAERGVHSVAYVSHACFVLAGTDHSPVAKAFETLKRESGLPESRFVTGAL